MPILFGHVLINLITQNIGPYANRNCTDIYCLKIVQKEFGLIFSSCLSVTIPKQKGETTLSRSLYTPYQTVACLCI